jgi:hypothetical protein
VLSSITQLISPSLTVPFQEYKLLHPVISKQDRKRFKELQEGKDDNQIQPNNTEVFWNNHLSQTTNILIKPMQNKMGKMRGRDQ